MYKKSCTITTLLLLFIIFLSLSACSDEKRELTLHSPGEYKGTTDPLLTTGQHPELKKSFYEGAD